MADLGDKPTVAQVGKLLHYDIERAHHRKLLMAARDALKVLGKAFVNGEESVLIDRLTDAIKCCEGFHQ